MRIAVFCLVSGLIPLFAWEGKVFEVSGKKVTIASSQTSGVRTGTRLYILKDGKEVGQGRVGNVFHTKVEMTLTGGVAEKGLVVTDKKLVAESGAASAPVPAKAELKAPTPETNQALIDAVLADDLAGSTRALADGADVDSKHNRTGYTDGITPLIAAVQRRKMPIVKLLVAANANINATTDSQWTALFYAAENGDLEIAKLLIDKKANVNAREVNSWTALMRAAQAGHAKVVSLLIKAGADVNAKNRYGDTALARADSGRHASIVALLRAAGAKE